jgi:sulfite reductase (ferredoxin)
MIDFDLAAAERLYFEAQLAYGEGDYTKADNTAYKAMLAAAKGLVRTRDQDIGDDAGRIVAEFRTFFVETDLFRDKYAGNKFAEYLFRRHEDAQRRYDKDQARHMLEETQLYIEAAHACNARLLEQRQAAAAPPKPAGSPATA